VGIVVGTASPGTVGGSSGEWCAVKRAANVASMLAIIWGGCFLMTLPFGLSDLGFSLIFATVLTAAILLIAGVRILFKRGRDALKRR
jgi:hypothetical protein